jgi:Leucine-rich repeat (LRR) protein
LAGNQVSDVSPLSKLSRLRYLDLSRNQIEDIAPLALAGNLGSLDLSSNGVADIEPLRGLRQLWSLDLSTNSIRNLEALEGLESLTFLNLDSNRVQDLAPLSNLTALRSLSLNENVISDISPLIDLARRRSRTGSGAVFWSVQLRGNELDAEDRALAELEKYSVYVGRPETGRSSSPEKDASDSGRSAETAVSAMRGEHRGSLSARQTFLTNHKRRL